MNITDRAAKALKLSSGKQTATLIEGHLMLQLKNNRKTWRFRYTNATTKKRVFLNIGTYPATGVAKARQEAAQLDGLLEDGKDPKAETAQQQVDNLTVSWLITEFIKKDLKKNRKAVWQPESLLNVHVKPAIGKVLLTELNTQHITKLVDAITTAGHNVTSNKVLSIIKQMLSFGERRGHLTDNVARKLSQRDAGGAESPRERNLSFEEVKQLWLYLDDKTKHRTSKPIVIMLKLLIITGQRTGDILNADWSEFDFDAELWTIPASRYKTSIDHKVNITSTMTALLGELLEPDAKNHPQKGRLFTHESKAASRAVRRSYQPNAKGVIRLDIPQFTVHDLRRTCASRMSDLKVDAIVIEKVLGHKLPKILAAYNKGEMLPERQAALELWQQTIINLVSNNNVIQLSSTS